MNKLINQCAGGSLLGGVAGSMGAGAAGCSIAGAAAGASSFLVQANITDNPPTTIKIRSAFIFIFLPYQITLGLVFINSTLQASEILPENAALSCKNEDSFIGR